MYVASHIGSRHKLTARMSCHDATAQDSTSQAPTMFGDGDDKERNEVEAKGKEQLWMIHAPCFPSCSN